jgi:hypothetical protein
MTPIGHASGWRRVMTHEAWQAEKDAAEELEHPTPVFLG